MAAGVRGLLAPWIGGASAPSNKPPDHGATLPLAVQGIGFSALLIALQGLGPGLVAPEQVQDSGGRAEYSEHEALALKGEIDRTRQQEANDRGKALKKARTEAAALLKRQADERAQQLIHDEAAAYKQLHEPLTTGPVLVDETDELVERAENLQAPIDVAMVLEAVQETATSAPDTNSISLVDDNENRRRIALLLLLLG